MSCAVGRSTPAVISSNRCGRIFAWAKKPEFWTGTRSRRPAGPRSARDAWRALGAMENKWSRVRESRTSRRGHLVGCRGRYPLGDRRDVPSAATSDGEFHDVATGNGVSAPRARGSGRSEVRVSKERQTKSVFCLVRLSDRNANECRVGVYPMVLPARNPVYSLTATSAKGGVYGLRSGLFGGSSG